MISITVTCILKNLTNAVVLSVPMAQIPPPENAVVDIATTLSLDLLRPPLVDVEPFDVELAAALLLLQLDELDDDELDDRGSVEASRNIISHSSSHSFSVKIRPYCIF